MPAEADEADECMAIENLLEECASHAGDHEGERVESRSPWHDGRYRYTKYLLALQACRKAEREGTPHAGGSSVPTECGRVEKSPHRRVQDRLPVLGPSTTVSSPEHAIGRKNKQTNNNKQTTQFGEQFWKKECAEGGIGNSKGITVIAVGVIPKSQPSKFRTFPHLLARVGIDRKYGSMKYTSIDDAAEMMSRLEPGMLLAKIDIAQAYRNVPIHPADRSLLGRGAYMQIKPSHLVCGQRQRYSQRWRMH